MKTILVTGGAGYVGSVLVPMLLDCQYKVVVLDTFWFWDDVENYNDSIVTNIKNKNYIENLSSIKGDIRDKSLVKYVLQQNINYIINLACISNDPSSDLDPNFTYDVSFNGVCNIMKMALSECNNLYNFIQASSNSVYGIKKEEKVTENLKLEPLTQYSQLKVETEKFLLKTGLPCIIIRPSTICGYSPRQRLDLMINMFVDQAVNNNMIKVFGGGQYRPTLHIIDMCYIYLSLLQSDKINGQIYNAGYEYDTALNFATTISNKTGCLISILETQDSRSYRTCSEKLEKELCFSYSYNSYIAMNDLIIAFSNNKINKKYSINTDVMKNILS